MPAAKKTAAKKTAEKRASTPRSQVVGNNFVYTTRAGKTLKVPLISYLPFGVARAIRKLDEDDQVFELVERACDATALAVLDEMMPDEVGDFMEKWQAASGVTVGE